MTSPNSEQRLLGVFAHPDDECFGCGGTLALLASQGVNIALMCATRGEAGEIADPAMATPETLGQVREKELYASADALGVKNVTFMDYRDSGMAGTADNENPLAFVRADESEVVSKIVGVMREFKPHVVMTWDQNGGYGHPDHIAISRHTVTAFSASGDASQFAEHGEPWEPSRLFYAIMSRRRMLEMRDVLQSLGQDTSRLDRRIAEGMGWPDEEVDVVMDVSSKVDEKIKSRESHQTQTGTFGPFRRMPQDMARQFLSQEQFHLVLPKDAQGMTLSNLFDGVD